MQSTPTVPAPISTAGLVGRVAVVGASGYGGLQSLRLLQRHPQFAITFLGGERSAGKRWSELCPFLPLVDDLSLIHI